MECGEDFHARSKGALADSPANGGDFIRAEQRPSGGSAEGEDEVGGGLCDFVAEAGEDMQPFRAEVLLGEWGEGVRLPPDFLFGSRW